MSKLAILTGILAVVVLFAGASVVFAQEGSQGFGGRMMQAPVTPDGVPNICQNATGDGTTMGPGHMGGNHGAMMGNPEEMQKHMSENWETMRQAMESGNMEQMQSVCRNAHGGTEPQTPPATTSAT